jgi:beta-mannosidase
LRARDPERYLALSRVATGEVMEATLSEWRSGATCAGALVWTLGDLRPGAGWGLLDSRGVPKAAYWLLRRALQPVALLLTDEGLSGLRLHVANDSARAIDATLEVALYRGERAVDSGTVPVHIPARSVVTKRAHDALGRFTDITYAFRFGPSQHEVVVATLRGADGAMLSEAVHFPAGRARVLDAEPHLEAEAQVAGAETFAVRLWARQFAYAVALELDPPCVPEENYFHLAPGKERRVLVRGAGNLSGTARALNGAAVRIKL